jgi:protein-disulfide isomerase
MRPQQERELVALMLVASACFAGLALAKVRGNSNTAALTRVQVSPQELAPASRLLLGSPDAPNKLVMFGDYECPPCRTEWPTVEAFYKTHSGKWAVYFRHYPLFQLHPHAIKAAEFALASGSGVSLLKMHDALFYSKRLDTYLDRLSSAKHGPAVNSKTELGFRKEAVDDMHLGESLGVTGTPAFFYIDPNGETFRAFSLAAATKYPH